MATPQTLSESLEDYLETLYSIIAIKGAARVKDVTARLGVSAASVTGALRNLAARGLVNYAPYDVVTLTSKGKAAATDVLRRHEVLRDFFVRVLAVPEQEAESAACRMEHAVSRTVLERLVDFVEFVEDCPRGGTKWIHGFGYYCEHGRQTGDCERCIEACLAEVQRDAGRSNADAGSGKEHGSMRLTDLKPGAKARITRMHGRGASVKRLVDMGVGPGAVVQMERAAPFGDPIEIKVKGYHLSLRKEEARSIEVDAS